MAPMHSLLRRQLERQGLKMETAPEEMRRLMEAVDQAYRQFDDDRAMLERSLELSSQELLQANSDMRTLFQALPDLLFRLDSKGTILESKGSSESESDLLLPAAQLVGRRIQEIPVPDLVPRFTRALAELQSTGKPVQVEYSLTLRGTEQIFEARLVPALGDQALVIVRNITARRRAEAELKESEERYRQLVQNAPLGILVADRSGRITLANERLVSLLGSASVEATRELNLNSFPPIVTAGIAGDFARCVEKGESFVTRRPYCSLSGKSVEMRLHLAPLRGAGGAVEAVQVLVEDFTGVKLAEQERALLEEQLRQAMKMEAIGRLAGGIAHDFNNILTAICGNAEFLIAGLEPDHPYRPDVLEIEKAARRAAALTAQLLAFSRKQIIAPRVLDLNRLVAESTSMLRRLLGEDMRFDFTPASVPCLVRADPGQLEQMLTNLAVNSRDAMPDGGALAVATEVLELDASFCRSHAGVVPGRFVRLSVKDTGCGMDLHTREHLYEPFFTTKERGRGTGLGLSQVYGIVMQNQGLITVESAPGQGTEFHIFLPAVEGSIEQDAPHARPARPPSGSERVLLVEDEAAVRELTSRILRKQGYQVVEAASAEAALQTMEARPGPIDLLVTDVIMPGMNGRDLHRRLSETRPGLKVVFMSGYSWDVVARHGVLDPGTHFLAKPFAVDELARKVREALDG